jgi:hypothetical protein
MQRASFMRPFGGARSLANAAKHGRANVNFSDFQNAYRPKTTAEIVNSIACFTACEQPWIVKNSEELYNVSKNLLGPVVDDVVRETFFKHFCAGEDQVSTSCKHCCVGTRLQKRTPKTTRGVSHAPSPCYRLFSPAAQRSIAPTVQRLRDYGVGAILDYGTCVCAQRAGARGGSPLLPLPGCWLDALA